MKNGQDIPLIFLKGGRNLKTLVEGKDYSVHEYVTKDKRKDNNRPMCPICSNCNHKEFCANRKKLFKMKECEDCSNCKDKEHCDKFYIYQKFKVELLTNGRKSTTKDTNRIQFNGKTKEESLNKMLEYVQDVSIHGKTEKTKQKDATIVSIREAYETKRVRNKEIKPSTYNRSLQTIKAIENYKFANIPIQNVTANQIKQYLESERAKSNSSIDKYYSKIKKAFAIAYANGVIQKNLFLIGDGIKKPESFKEDKKVDAFTRKEEYVLTEYLKTHKSKYKLILLVALYTEMRIGEILALRPSDINIVGNIGSINVRRTLTKTINTYGYIYSYLRQKELNQKYTKYMQDTNAILEENFERFEEEYLKLK